MAHQTRTHLPTTRLYSALFMTRPATWSFKEFLNEMLALFSGTLANVSSLKARPLVTKTGYLLCYVIMYHTHTHTQTRFKYYLSRPSSIPRSATRYFGSCGYGGDWGGTDDIYRVRCWTKGNM